MPVSPRLSSTVRTPSRTRRATMITALAATLLVPVATRAADPGPGGAQAPQATVLVLGDSLAVGMRPHLGGLLLGRRIVWDARSGRTSPQGLVRLRAQLRREQPDVVLVSLGTNDGSDPRRFTSRLRRALAAIPPSACVVWSDLYRPARKGAYTALNRALRAERGRDERLHVLAWERAVHRGTVALPDGLHPDRAGFRHRSRMYARALARDCER